MEEKIKGGYVMIARQMLNSPIMDFPLTWRFLWVWLIVMANHSDVVRYGQVFHRGELLTTYEKMISVCVYGIGWRKKKAVNKNGIESFMKRLKKEEMITTRKTTKGLFIRIVNYGYYQNASNYEAYNEAEKKTTTKPQTPDNVNKNDKNEKNEEFNTGKSPETEDKMKLLEEDRKKLAEDKGM